MRLSALTASALTLVFVSSVTGRAHAAPNATDADTLFKAAKTLRDAGKVAEACAAFEQSKQLAPGVGVTLFLADCYERLGRTASAWTQFREAEKLAHDRKDKRADVAHRHAATLESKVNRVVVVVSPALALAGTELRVDGTGPIPESDWKSGFAVDPGDHLVTLGVPGAPPHVARAHVDATIPVVTVTIGDPPPLPVAAPVVPPAAPPPAAVTPPEPMGHSDLPTRRIAMYGLLGASVVGVGVGGAFLAAKNQSVTNDPNGSPQMDHGAAIGSTVAFAAGGAALVSAIVLYLTAPEEKESALIVTPSPIAGGGGAVVRGSF
jgi:hypothetical protein